MRSICGNFDEYGPIPYLVNSLTSWCWPLKKCNGILIQLLYLRHQIPPELLSTLANLSVLLHVPCRLPFFGHESHICKQHIEKILNFVLRADTGRYELDRTLGVRTKGRKGKVKVSHRGGKGHDIGKVWRGREGARGETLDMVETRTQGRARPDGTVKGRATIGNVPRHDKGRDMAGQDKLDGKEEDEIVGSDGRRKVSTW